ncbi:MAG: Fe-S cluster assembly sulfur transfer protein SufU [Thermoplasmatota archaeon]
MYRDHILEHYKHPRNFGALEPADIDHREDNPLCGDDIRMTVRLDADSNVSEVRFSGRGCAISQASASMLTERVVGKPLDEVKKLSRDDIVAMLGIPISPVRLKCATLGLVVLRDGIDGYEAARK